MLEVTVGLKSLGNHVVSSEAALLTNSTRLFGVTA